MPKRRIIEDSDDEDDTESTALPSPSTVIRGDGPVSPAHVDTQRIGTIDTGSACPSTSSTGIRSCDLQVIWLADQQQNFAIVKPELHIKA